jgi:mycothiol synthase
MVDHTVRPYRPGDAEALHELHVRHAQDDYVDVHSSIEPLLDADGVRNRMAAAEWAVVAAGPAGTVVGWAALRSWTEDAGNRIYLTDGYVAPPARRRGLGTGLLREAETVAAQHAAGRSETWLGGNASTVQPDRAALLERHGYRHVFAMVEMEHDRSPVPVRALPEGVAVRAATVADAGPLRALAARVWAGRAYFTLPSEESFRDWLRRADLSLIQVATAGDLMVAVVAVNRTPARTEIDDVQVHPEFQRRGLATALLGRALAGEAAPIRLHTEGSDPAGARALYERLGFRVVREYGRYRKPLGL